MERRLFMALSMLLPAAGVAGMRDWFQPASGNESQAAALRELLSQGSVQAVTLLGRTDGYFANPRVRIPMPEKLQRIERSLRRLGQGGLADEFVLSLNRAAETAAPEAKAVFLEVVRGLTLRDAVDIVRGPDDAATRYLRSHAGTTLTSRFLPIVARATDQVGVTARYKKLVRRGAVIGGALDLSGFDLDNYVTQRALDGLFLLIADEELRIRREPAARTTELLRRVFK
jgi:Protein of unknown function (DUF4197)